MTGEKDAADLCAENAQKADPAERPGVEEIGWTLAVFFSNNRMPCMSGDPRDRLSPLRRRELDDAARAILALFAPILAEKEAAEEQAESFKAMYRQAVDWRDEKIAKLTTRAEDAEFAMSRVEKSAASAEARALAAEAALAAERDMLKRIVDLHADWRLCMPNDWEGDPLSDACEDAAAAIRAEGAG